MLGGERGRARDTQFEVVTRVTGGHVMSPSVFTRSDTQPYVGGGREGVDYLSRVPAEIRHREGRRGRRKSTSLPV